MTDTETIRPRKVENFALSPLHYCCANEPFRGT